MAAIAGISRLLSFSWLTGPIFAKEVRTASRRGRYYWLRFAYLALLAIYIAAMWLDAVTEVNPATAYGQAQIADAGKKIVSSIVWFQFIAMQIFAIILMSDSISGEITGRTMGVLITTPITSLQIVVGKLLSGMLQIFLLLAISLPLLGLLRVLGGIPWDYLAAGLCLTVCASTLAGALALMLSIRIRQPYVTIAIALAIEALFYFAGSAGGYACCCLLAPVYYIDPFGSLASITSEFMQSMPLSTGNWLIPCIFMLCALEAIICVSVLRVGRLAMREDKPRQPQIVVPSILHRDGMGGELARLEAISDKSLRRPPAAAATAASQPPPNSTAKFSHVPPPAGVASSTPPPSLPSPPQRSTRLVDELRAASAMARKERMLELDSRPISEINTNPVLWREMNKGAMKWASWTRCISLYIAVPPLLFIIARSASKMFCFGSVLAVACVGIVGFIIITSRERGKHLIAFLVAMAATTTGLLLGPDIFEWSLLLFCMLATAIPAATSIASERESRTLELLYATGMSDWQIIYGKAAGVFLKNWPVWLCMLVVPFDAFIVHGQFSPGLFLLSAMQIALMLAFVICMGQFCSVFCRRATSSAAMCISFLGAVWLILPLFLYSFSSVSHRDLAFLSPVGLFSREGEMTVPAENYFLVIGEYLLVSAVLLLIVRLLLRLGIYQQK